MNSSPKMLANRLIELGYDGLFLSGDGSDLDAIWGEAGNPEALNSLISDNAIAWQARFLAAEILFTLQPGFPPEALVPTLAALYARALTQSGVSSQGLTFPANRWGLLYEYDDPGDVGQHLVGLGEAALPELTPLLLNNDQVLFEGSEEAAVGNLYQFRIKDFAAFYICKIKHLPIKYHKNRDKRDIEIRKLLKQIST